MFRRISTFIGTILTMAFIWLNLTDRNITFKIALSQIMMVDYMILLIICIEYLENREKYKTRKSLIKLIGISLAIMAAGNFLYFKVCGVI